jgi:hypothetical protein
MARVRDERIEPHAKREARGRVLHLAARDAQPVSVGDITDLSEIVDPGKPLAGLPEPAPDPDADPGFLASLGQRSIRRR